MQPRMGYSAAHGLVTRARNALAVGAGEGSHHDRPRHAKDATTTSRVPGAGRAPPLLPHS